MEISGGVAAMALKKKWPPVCHETFQTVWIIEEKESQRNLSIRTYTHSHTHLMWSSESSAGFTTQMFLSFCWPGWSYRRTKKETKQCHFQVDFYPPDLQQHLRPHSIRHYMRYLNKEKQISCRKKKRNEDIDGCCANNAIFINRISHCVRDDKRQKNMHPHTWNTLTRIWLLFSTLFHFRFKFAFNVIGRFFFRTISSCFFLIRFRFSLISYGNDMKQILCDCVNLDCFFLPPLILVGCAYLAFFQISNFVLDN